jgi:hypothetical protein
MGQANGNADVTRYYELAAIRDGDDPYDPTWHEGGGLEAYMQAMDTKCDLDRLDRDIARTLLRLDAMRRSQAFYDELAALATEYDETHPETARVLRARCQHRDAMKTEDLQLLAGLRMERKAKGDSDGNT